MLVLIQKYFYPLLLAIIALLGVALANLAAASFGIYLRPSNDTDTHLSDAKIAPPEQPSLKDFEIIRQRNIFDSTAGPLAARENRPEPETEMRAAKSRADLQLIGTVTGGEASLALLIIDRGEIESYRLGDDLPGGGTIDEITRHQIVIRNTDGTQEIIPLYAEGTGSSAETTKTASVVPDSAGGVQAIGQNRYVIDRRAAEAARNNIPQLLRQARLEPNIVGGQTQGFEVKMIRPNSLLARLGMRKGDVLVEVNGLKLDSPEKGLQVFQQLREAKNIDLGLTRGGEPMSLTYEIK